MIKAIMKRFALSREGAKGFVWAVVACVVQDLMLMLPVSLLYFLVNDFLNGAVPTNHYYLYGFGILGALLLIFFSEWCKYNATYFTTYRESGIKRVRLAEKLRKLPLSFFGKAYTFYSRFSVSCKVSCIIFTPFRKEYEQ